MTMETDQNQALAAEDYVVVGVAACYQRDEGELQPLLVLEPIPSAYLESIFQGVPTSYQCVLGTTVGAMLAEASQTVDIAGAQGVQRCENFRDRVAAAARTYQSRPATKALVAPGQIRTDLNHSTEKKRVLNLENIVKTEDNVRQHAYTHQTL